MGITVVLLLFLLLIFFGVFMAKPPEVSPALVFNKPKVNIDMAVFDSDQFKNLQPFPEMQAQYSYTAITKDKKTQTGFISAVSIEQARTVLQGIGLTVSDIKEVQIGRDNPFASYYQLVALPAAGTKTTPKTK